MRASAKNKEMKFFLLQTHLLFIYRFNRLLLLGTFNTRKENTEGRYKIGTRSWGQEEGKKTPNIHSRFSRSAAGDDHKQ